MARKYWVYKAHVNTHPDEPNGGVDEMATDDIVSFQGSAQFDVVVTPVGKVNGQDLAAGELFEGSKVEFTADAPSGTIQYDLDKLWGWSNKPANQQAYFELRSIHGKLRPPSGGVPPKIPPG